MTLAEVKKRIAGLNNEQQKKVVCSLVRHSAIHTNCFGYKYCARCGEQVGDSLGGVYDGKNTVLVGHNCKVCRKNYKRMDWKDKFLTPNPFAKEKADGRVA